MGQQLDTCDAQAAGCNRESFVLTIVHVHLCSDFVCRHSEGVWMKVCAIT